MNIKQNVVKLRKCFNNGKMLTKKIPFLTRGTREEGETMKVGRYIKTETDKLFFEKSEG